MSGIDVPAPSEREALEELVQIIDAAGLANLSNGVQVGPTAWFVKALDALNAARAALSVPCRQSSGWGGGGGYVQEGADVISDHAASAPSISPTPSDLV